MKHLLYFPKWFDLLIKINKAPDHKRYSQKLHRELSMSINHLRAILKQMEQANIIEILSSRKIKWIVLTDKGKELSQAIQSIGSSL